MAQWRLIPCGPHRSSAAFRNQRDKSARCSND